MEELKEQQDEIIKLQSKILSINEKKIEILEKLKGKCFYHTLMNSDETIRYMYKIEGRFLNNIYGIYVSCEGIEFMKTIDIDIKDKEISYEDFKEFTYEVLKDKLNRN